MDEDKILLAIAATMLASSALLLLENGEEKRKIVKTKREWVKMWRLQRNQTSSYTLPNSELRLEDVNAYRRHLRMDENCFVKLLKIIRPSIMKTDTHLRDSIPPEESLGLVLRFLATGESYRHLDKQTGISLAYISEFIPYCCTVIYSKLKSYYLQFPTSVTEWEIIADEFSNLWQFPNCLGALDTYHIPFRGTQADADLYCNNKGFNSIVLLVLCDALYRFTYVDVGYNGRTKDEDVLSRSDLFWALENPSSYFPPDKIIGNDRKLPFCVIGDDAFPLQRYLMKPYPYKCAEIAQKTFNYRLSHARQTIEHSLGMLSNKFQVLQSNMYLRPEKIKVVAQACCALHNFLLRHSADYRDELPCSSKQTPEESSDDISTEEGDGASAIRDEFAIYFTKEGKLPWLS